MFNEGMDFLSETTEAEAQSLRNYMTSVSREHALERRSAKLHFEMKGVPESDRQPYRTEIQTVEIVLEKLHADRRAVS